ncbi:MAG: CAP domain-containing protein [Methylococcaceae bacterium]
MMTNSKNIKPIININRRHMLSESGLACLSGLLFLQGCVSGSSHLVEPKRGRPNTQPLRYDAVAGFRKLNAIRKKHLLTSFTNDRRLQKAAQDYANLMGSRGLYGHEIGPGTDFKTRIFAVGYNNSSGENIGVGYNSVDKALIGWLDSPGHRKNMLKPQYTLAGLAYGFNTSGKNPRYTHYWVLIMGKDDGRYSPLS